MKKMLLVLIVLCCVSALAFAEEATAPAATTEPAATVEVIPAAEPAEVTPAAEPVVVTPVEPGVLVAPPVEEVTAAPAAETVVETPAAATTPEVLTLKGDLTDNMCAGMNKDTLAEFVKTHTKECATKAECAQSGYSIFTDGELYKFDTDSSAKVAEFLTDTDSKLQVTVTAKQVGDELSLVSIENQN